MSISGLRRRLHPLPRILARISAILREPGGYRTTAAVKEHGEMVGLSNGDPSQSFTVRNSPVVAGAPRMKRIRYRNRRHPERPLLGEAEAHQVRIRKQERRKGFLLEVDEGGGLKPWQEVRSFSESGQDDHHYVLDRVTGEVQFGDGVHGKIPPTGSRIVAYYRYSGGPQG